MSLEAFHAMDREILSEQYTLKLKPNTRNLRRALILAMWTLEHASDDADSIAELKEIVAAALTVARHNH